RNPPLLPFRSTPSTWIRLRVCFRGRGNAPTACDYLQAAPDPLSSSAVKTPLSVGVKGCQCASLCGQSSRIVADLSVHARRRNCNEYIFFAFGRRQAAKTTRKVKARVRAQKWSLKARISAFKPI